MSFSIKTTSELPGDPALLLTRPAHAHPLTEPRSGPGAQACLDLRLKVAAQMQQHMGILDQVGPRTLPVHCNYTLNTLPITCQVQGETNKFPIAGHVKEKHNNSD